MPATSKKQQQLMGIVHALQTGDMKPSQASGKAKEMAKSMKKGDVTDFASTKHKGLPKKVKKENLDGAIETLYMVQKPYAGCELTSLVKPIDPLVGLEGSEIVADQVHGVYPDQDQADVVANELYEAYCAKEDMLEEKKGQVGEKIKKAIDQLEKKHKEHINLAKEDPKNASKHKEHIAKIAHQIDDLMTKLEKIEKSKKEIKKDEKKSLKEAYEVHFSDGVRQAKKFKDPKAALSFAKQLISTNKNLQSVDVFNAGPNFHSTADTDAVIAWWGPGSYMDNKSKKDAKLAAKKIK
jgi:valyl-tRNA synthetase